MELFVRIYRGKQSALLKLSFEGNKLKCLFGFA